ncbi:unnamed protein product [Bathycoccus prasinos]
MMRDDDKDEKKNLFLSENFSALHALNSDDAPIHTDDDEYPIFDHIGKCRFMLPRTHPDFLDSEMKNQLPRQSEESKRKQEALKARAMRLRDAEKKFAQREHAVEVIASRFKGGGPLSLLYRALHEKKRVKIVTRNERGVRGCMECNISAFDKYFNFVAHDIEERYSVRVRKEKEYVNGKGETKTRRRKVIEQRERKVSQMFLRGESVVLVALAEDEEYKEEEEEEEEDRDAEDDEGIADDEEEDVALG